MFQIIVGTNRPRSFSMEVAQFVRPLYEREFQVHLIDLRKVPLGKTTGKEYSDNQPKELQEYVDRVTEAEGLLMVCPEYNGSMPGILKYFIDHWKYPDSFLFKPVAFIGLGGMFGGLRAVEHLQQIFGYRNAFIYPKRVFLINVWDHFEEGQLTHPTYVDLIKEQCQGFSKFLKKLKK